jgi:hypothetical protein
LKSRTLRIAVFSPSYLQSLVKRTVRIGMLTPTPRVSVPQMTSSLPCWASCSTSRRYLGSRPAWCRPMPLRMKRGDLLAEGGVEAEALQGRGDRLLLLAGDQLQAHQVLGLLGALALGEVDDVDRRAVAVEQVGQGLVERGLAVLEVEGHRAHGGAHDRDLALGQALRLSSSLLVSPRVADISMKLA